MAIRFDGPRQYDFNQPLFTEGGKITERVSAGLENVLAAYVELATGHAKYTENNPRNYKVKEVYVVGSGARAFVRDSDLDLLLEVPDLDEKSCDGIKMFLGMIFFADRPKIEAVDAFVRQRDKYPERANIKITDQVSELLDRYNGMLDSE
ncbi:MAG: hypothetical protein WC595_03260 [Candidatus Nanoarchaeia archaeon]